MHKLGLLPLVEELAIRVDHPRTVVSQQLFKPRILRQFMAFTNVQDLQIGYLDIPSFMPRIRQSFGPFLPTVKSLTLVSPRGSYQQVIFFIGSFQHLEDLMLHGDTSCTPGMDSTLIPPFVPPLQGRLVVWCLKKEGFLRDMIRSFGGIKFIEMDIFDVAETRLFLSACAKTLRSLELHPTDPHGERPDLYHVMRFSTNESTVTSLLDFDLSQIESLRALEVAATSIDLALRNGLPGAASKILKYALSTIRSPEFSRVELFYQEQDFRGVHTDRHSEWPHLRDMSQAERAEEASRHHRRFELFREMHRVRDFQLFLCLNVWGSVEEYTVQALREAAAAERENGLSDGSYSEPVVAYYLRWNSLCGAFPW